MKLPVTWKLSLLLLTASIALGPITFPQTAFAQQATAPQTIKQWFNSYDRVRRQAQMNPQERARADQLLATSVMSSPPAEQEASRALLSKLISRYDGAIAQLKGMPLYPETGDLHRGYYQYFSTAKALFSDCLKMQGHLMAMDEKTGKPVALDLMKRKQELAMLDEKNKQLDAELRSRYGIPAYVY